MPYTLPLRDVPRLPDPSTKVMNADGTLSREYVSYFTQMRAWQERVQAALVEVEPP